MQNTLTPEDLSSLREAHTAYTDLKSELADIILMESRMSTRKTQLIHDIPVSEKNLRNIEGRIRSEYNAAVINLGTGEITPNETPG